MSAKIVSIIGAGSWGTALSVHLAQKDIRVQLWCRNEELAREMVTSNSNNRYLPGVKLPENIEIYTKLSEALQHSKVIVCATPSHTFREILTGIKDNITRDSLIINVAKGLEESSCLRLSQVFAAVMGEQYMDRYVALSGPSHAEEVGRGIPTAIVAAAQSMEAANQAQDIFLSNSLRVYTNPDLTGVELGGALKNVIALGTGIADGLGLGDNTKAALMTRGLAEITRLGIKLGANPLTFAGLTGLGDLIVTCTSQHSRNRRAGIAIGRGKSLTEALAEVRMVVEGVRTTRVAYQLSRQVGVEMPITEQMYYVLFEGYCPRQAVETLMGRGRRNEIEEVALSRFVL
ncbi:MAG: NAD(P)H-dependent glycerol-3-phosphate dehydrogenase [Bacillota bacterium]|uniref:NAD(P)H-dependent glycerol-3-phosphate dehydrogenase n=1 Tax=Desulfurispora thermophila TaxID=265470 RepID=UPI000361359F|nr:NAD(P)H-dependent glycerol-3-phosphate dehydrogenase [Desulfurispora thermophila]